MWAIILLASDDHSIENRINVIRRLAGSCIDGGLFTDRQWWFEIVNSFPSHGVFAVANRLDGPTKGFRPARLR